MRLKGMLKKFFMELNEKGIRYCHWKSNIRINESMEGKTDLDLLVDRDDALMFRSVVNSYDFKPLITTSDKQYSGIEEFLGFDTRTGILSHLHVHYKLILGNRYLKNYHIPLEKEFLGSATIDKQTNVKMPSPEAEISIFVIRLILKTTIKFLLYGIIKNKKIISKELYDELIYLESKTNLKKIYVFLENNDKIPFVFIKKFFEILKSDKLNIISFLCIKFNIVLHIKRFRIHKTSYYIKRYVEKKLKYKCYGKIFRKKKFVFSGRTIAFVGSDGSGKSTVISSISKWLSWKICVDNKYMGSKKSSFVTKQIKKIYVVVGSLYRYAEQNIKIKFICNMIKSLYVISKNMYCVMLARDKYKRYYEGYRFAEQGGIVIFDRFPLKSFYGIMDGPSCEGDGRCTVLGRIEKLYFNCIYKPDHIIFLCVDSDVAYKRKPDHKKDNLIKKTRNVQRYVDMHHRDNSAINANDPLDTVILEVKKCIWTLI